MQEPSQSFTLDDNERQHILGEVISDHAETRSTPSQYPATSQNRPVSGGSTNPDIFGTRLFDHSYSQKFSQTQEDTSSFRQQVDNAPPIERDTHDIENIFDEGYNVEDFEPLETSTAVQAAKGRVEMFSPPSSIDDDDDGDDDDENVKNKDHLVQSKLQTPATARMTSHATPAGLTQMFQSSQDTPDLLQRKSTYVTMKDSQQHRRPISDDDDDFSGDEDPDFPKVRRSKSKIPRDSAAHSVMQRLRERTSMKSDSIDADATMVTHKSLSRRASLHRPKVQPQIHDDVDDSTIPASAPIIASSQIQDRAPTDEPDSIITDSQPVGSTPALHAIHELQGAQMIPSSPHYDTINFNLRSSLDDSPKEQVQTAAEESHDVHLDDAAIVPTTTDASSGDNHDDIETLADDLDQVHSQAASSQLSQPSRVPKTGHKDKPILLQDTPRNSGPYAVDLTITDPRAFDSKQLRRSMSHSLASSTTPVHTSIGTSIRSKSMSTPFQPPLLADPEHTSPITQAGDRRRSRKSNVILESPLEHIPFPSRKRGLVYSSLPDEEPPLSVHYFPPLIERGSKRLKLHAEINDSQSLRVQSKPQNTPEQPSLGINVRLRPRSLATGSGISQSPVDPDTDEDSVSSPLTSLASADFMQETSPHHLAKPGTTRWSRRVFALHHATDSYYPGDLIDCTAIKDRFSEDVVVSIKYDDTDEADLELQHVRPLDLRVGDVVKLNVTGIKLKQWTITSLKRDDKNGTLFTDIHGHTEFEARRKDSGQVASFPIDQIYIPSSLFRPFQKRQFSLIEKLAAKIEPETPSRRQLGRLKSLSPTLSMRGSQNHRTVGIFSGIAMSVTIAQSKTTSREKIERKISNHGGLLLADGLETLFESTPYCEDYDIAPLRLTSHAKTLRAAIVIADNPSRKAKYLQALSLGLPCLHHSYIDDCISAKSALEMSPYVLAAGEGRIGDCLVSLSMTCATTLSLTLPAHIHARRRVFVDKTMIIVTGPGRINRKIHLFLSWAMGCAELTECSTLEEAHHLFLKPEDGKRWDLISVQELNLNDEVVKDLARDLKGRIVTNEDVVQSLITGRPCITF